jgi:hypothetical protein
MKEPIAIVEFADGGEARLAYSLMPLYMLKSRAGGRVVWNAGEPLDPDFDPDFRRRYAAILLRERGL